MFKPVCDLCRSDFTGLIPPNQAMIFCTSCQPHAESYIKESLEIIQDAQTILDRRLENHRKDYLNRAKSQPVKRLEAVK